MNIIYITIITILVLLTLLSHYKARYRKKIISDMCQRVYKLRQILITKYDYTNKQLNKILGDIK